MKNRRIGFVCLLITLSLGFFMVQKVNGTSTDSQTSTANTSTNTVSANTSKEEERANLADVIEVETWHEIQEISEFKNFSPSIIKLDNGKYRIYWNDGPFDGIKSAISDDGITFTNEDGYRVQSTGKEGDPDCIASHPWVVKMDNGYRMYYQANENCDFGKNTSQSSSSSTFSQPIFRIMSAFSKDGLTFEREGIRIDIDDSTGLSLAAHGRVIQLDDGTYVMYFSGNFTGNNGPSDLLEATSTDGLVWKIDPKVLLQYGHDPSVVKIDDKFYIYAGYLAHNTVALESDDGYSFTPIKWVEFADTDDVVSDGFVDLDILLMDSGKMYIYGSGKESAIGVYQQSDSQGASTSTPTAQSSSNSTSREEAFFTDVSTKHANFTAIQYLAGIGTLKGYSDGSFRPSASINRAEFAKMLVSSQGYTPDSDKYKNCFSDVLDDWYAPYVCFAKEKKWVEGYADGTYKPADTIKKVEAIKMTITALGLTSLVPHSVDEILFDDTDSNTWYAPFLSVAKDLNLIEEKSGNFYPDSPMNRAYTAENLFRMKAVLYVAQQECSNNDIDCMMQNVQAYSVENTGAFLEQ